MVRMTVFTVVVWVGLRCSVILSQDERSPVPLEPWPDAICEFVTHFSQVGEPLTFEEAMSLLRPMQQREFDALQTARGRFWRNQIKRGEKMASVLAVDYAYRADPHCEKFVLRYPPRDRWGRSDQIEAIEFFPMLAYIRTPAMDVRAEGFASIGSGLSEIRIGLPRQSNIPVSGFRYGDMRMAGSRSPDDFWDELNARVGQEFYSYECFRNGNQVHLRVWQAANEAEHVRVWIFDLSQGGFPVEYENWIGRGSALRRQASFVQVDGCLVVETSSLEHVDLAKNQWVEKYEEAYFSTTVNVDVQKDFRIASLPLNEDFVAFDVRTGRSIRLEKSAVLGGQLDD